ncbi:MAG: ThuA domain-containing protein [Bacteroidota bacterium]
MKKLINYLLLIPLVCLMGACKSSQTGQKDTMTASSELISSVTMKALIIDGQNNHDMWPKTTVMMKQYLEESGMFSVDVERTAFTWKGDVYFPEYSLGKKTEAQEKPMADPNYSPDFSAYDVVISNFGWNAADWPQATQRALEEFVGGGGGLVIVHAADNSFPEWLEFNKMIGIGGWGGRTEKSGPYIYYSNNGELMRDDSEGRGGSHGPQHEFQIQIRDQTHPITQGMPEQWMHTEDELYDRLRGPAENMTVLATAYSSLKKKGTGRHEPMMMVLNYGQGRVFHTPMGHADYSMECVGFIVTLLRGTEWAATGKVTQTTLPEDFPNAQESKKRDFIRK